MEKHPDKWCKMRKGDKIWWLANHDKIGEFIFSFDKKKEFNFFRDYPHELTQEQIELFEKENPELAALK